MSLTGHNKGWKQVPTEGITLLCKCLFYQVVDHLLSQKHFFREILHSWRVIISSVIRQKGESQKGCFKKTKRAKFSEKRTFLTPWYALRSVSIRGSEIFVFWKTWRALFFWNTHFEIRPFALLPTIYGNNCVRTKSTYTTIERFVGRGIIWFTME